MKNILVVPVQVTPGKPVGSDLPCTFASEYGGVKSDGRLDFTGKEQPVLVVMTLPPGPFRFRAGHDQAVGFNPKKAGCPVNGGNTCRGVFEFEGQSDDGKVLAFYDDNRGSHADKEFLYSLFINDAQGHEYRCDPPIINN